MQLRRGRLLDHLHLVVADLEASKRFYAAVLGAVGVPIQHEGPEFFSADELYVSSTKDSATHALTGRHHFAFATRDRATVDAFHRAGLAAGGRDNGAPGERAQYHPGYYGAFLLDPDGNNVEAVYHGPATYSADAIVIDA